MTKYTGEKKTNTEGRKKIVAIGGEVFTGKKLLDPFRNLGKERG